MTYDELQKKVSKLLEDTEDKMTNLIEEYNESIEDNEDPDHHKCLQRYITPTN